MFELRREIKREGNNKMSRKYEIMMAFLQKGQVKCETDFVEMLKEHKILGALYENPQKDLRKEDIKEYRELIFEIIKKIYSQYSELIELSPNNEIVILKGMTVFWWTNSPIFARCGDIDILVKDMKKIKHELKCQGYKKCKESFLYEEGGYVKGETEIDLHNYFPIYSYKEKKLNIKYPIEGIEGNVLKEKRLCYREVEPFLYKTCDFCNINIIRPPLSMIIIASHIFNNYVNVWSISGREKPTIILGEIRDIFILRNHKYFDEREFWLLVKKYEAYEAIRFVELLGFIFYKLELFRNTIKKQTVEECLKEIQERYPRCLWWCFWYYPNITVKALLESTRFEIEKIVNKIALNEIAINREYKIEEFNWTYKFKEVIKGILVVSCYEDKWQFKLKILGMEESNRQVCHIRVENMLNTTEIIYKGPRIISVGKPNIFYQDEGGLVYEIDRKGKKLKVIVEIAFFRNEKLKRAVLIPLKLTEM